MTDLYAVIGNPIGHTKSPLLHNSFAEQAQQDMRYIAVEGPLGGFRECVDRLRSEGLLGLNVTAPFKLDAFAYAASLTERARLAGAVNTLNFQGDQIAGDNTDGIGLVGDIQRNLGCPVQGRRVLLLGAGGAARGAILPFLEQKPAELVIVNRTVSKANDLGEEFSAYGPIVAAGYDVLRQEIGGHYDIVVNATSASLTGEVPPLHERVFHGCALAYDLAYGKGLTPFLRLAGQGGARQIADGVGMLVEQAAEAFGWWRGVRPDTRAMVERMTIPLE